MKQFMLGCNYWDSASGTDMWKNWDPETVDADLKALKECGVECLRVFPNWRDFQPVKKLYAQRGTLGEYVYGEEEECLDDHPCGLSEEMVDHFREFAKIADRYGMKLMVSLVTGWMSGRLFLPQPVEGKNPISDPEALMWTSRFVTGLVSALKDIPNIIWWDLGNECNNLGSVASRAECYTWTAMVRNAIRAADPSRPISSGMHGLSAEDNGIWHLKDQGELCDLLTAHPYPSPTVNGDMEPANRMRTTIVPTAQSEFYSGIGGKPAMIQESGTFNTAIANREMAADFLRVNVLSAWANNLTGYLWWCGMEHLNLKQSPYSWSMLERELGLVDGNRVPKRAGQEMKRIGQVLNALPELPDKDIDAVCVLPKENRFPKAAACYTLAKEAGFNVKIVTDQVPEADAYIIPSIEFWAGMHRRNWDVILDRVENHGASLLITFDGGVLTEFERITGLRSNGYRHSLGAHTASFSFGEITYRSRKEMLLESIGAEVLARNEEGNVVFSRNSLGKGSVYCLNFGLEANAWAMPEGMNPEVTQPWYKIYELFGRVLRKRYLVQTDCPFIGITQSKLEDGAYIVTAINYSDVPRKLHAAIKDGYSPEVLYGDPDTIPACEAVIFKIIRTV